MLDNDSALRPKRTNSPASKKNKGNERVLAHNPSGMGRNDLTANDYQEKCKELAN